MKAVQFIPLFLLGILFFGCGESSQQVDNSSTVEETATPVTQHNMLSESEKADGWQLLFDGSTTTGWRGYNQETFPTKGWDIKNGELQVIKTGTEEEGYGGDIITNESYENFELTLEYAVTDSSNSGILYLVNEKEGQAIWHSAPEYQILDNPTYTSMGLGNTQLTAANYDLHPASTDYTQPKGEWNEVRIVLDDGHVEHWLNDNKVVEYDLWTPEWEALVQKSKFKDYPDYGKSKKGPIGIQDHGHLVRFRNIKIKRL